MLKELFNTWYEEMGPQILNRRLFNLVLHLGDWSMDNTHENYIRLIVFIIEAMHNYQTVKHPINEENYRLVKKSSVRIV